MSISCAHPMYLHLTSFMPTQTRIPSSLTNLMFQFGSLTDIFSARNQSPPATVKSFVSLSWDFPLTQSKFCRFTATAKPTKFIVLVLTFNSALQRDGNHELFFSFRCRHLSTKLTLLCTQSTNSHRMTPYLLKYFHNTQHVLPQVMSGQACNVSLYLSLTNIRAHQSFLLSIVCSGSPKLMFIPEDADGGWISLWQKKAPCLLSCSCTAN